MKREVAIHPREPDTWARAGHEFRGKEHDGAPGTSSHTAAMLHSPVRLPVAIALGALLTSALWQGCHHQSPPEYGPIRILAPFNLTGSGSNLDLAAFYGARIAARQINAAGGVRGRNLQLIAVDTASNVSVAVKAVERALDSESNVAAGVGYCDSAFVKAVAPLFQRARLPFVSPGATNPALPTKVGNMMFLTAYGDDAQAQAMAEYAYRDLDTRSLAVWMDESHEYTTNVATLVAQAFRDLGGRVSMFTEPPEIDDFASFSRAFRASQPSFDAIYGATMPKQAVAFITQVRAAGIDIPLLSGDAWDGGDVAAVSSDQELSAIYFTTHRFLDVDTDAMKIFSEAYEQARGTAPTNAFAALGYDAVGLLADAMKRAGSTKPSAVRAALASTTDYPGLVAPISYRNGSRVPIKPVAIVEVNRGEEAVASTITP